MRQMGRSCLVKILYVGMQEGGGVEGWQAHGREAFGSLQERVAGGDEVAQHEQIALGNGVWPSLSHSTHQVPDQHDAEDC